jgi:hypothetical protein
VNGFFITHGPANEAAMRRWRTMPQARLNQNRSQAKNHSFSQTLLPGLLRCNRRWKMMRGGKTTNKSKKSKVK